MWYVLIESYRISFQMMSFMGEKLVQMPSLIFMAVDPACFPHPEGLGTHCATSMVSRHRGFGFVTFKESKGVEVMLKGWPNG